MDWSVADERVALAQASRRGSPTPRWDSLATAMTVSVLTPGVLSSPAAALDRRKGRGRGEDQTKAEMAR